MTDACDRPGCTGSYAADGYCDECGHKRPAVAAGPSATGSTAGGGRTAGKTAAKKGTKAAAKAAPGTGQPSGSTGRTGRTRGGTRGVAVTSATAAGLGGSSSSTGTGTRRTVGRGGLGANLVAVPPVPLRDPTTAVMADPQVPESHRYCSKCGEPVGRGRGGKPGRAEGFCPKDRTPFSFLPRLSPGDLVDNRYEILGALAHGGLGWIYLARDRNISESGADRWVVLKGLINTGDADAMAAAMAERRFLVEVDHPNIVKIHDFAQHPDPKTGELVGYIVMEYVGGRSLKDLALTHTGPDGARAPLPLDQVLAYGIEILPAIGYLHGRGLLFCDFKPDNVIHAEEQLKLIDLGAVRRIDDQASPLWGTPGYQAPELETEGASIASDIYTVGRTLAVLSFDFGGFSTRYSASLPDPGDVELLAQEESYYRLLLRATHTNPRRRFASAGELAEQSLGVLREVLSTADGVPRPAGSAQFTPERRVFGAGSTSGTATATPAAGVDGAAVAAALPLPLVDPSDPAAGFLATLGGDPQSILAALDSAPVQSIEVSLRLVRAQLDAGDPAAATTALRATKADPDDWRVAWFTGLIALAANAPAEAVTAFDAVYSALPGEPAARLALAVAAELAGDREAAIRRYLSVWRVDHGFVSAAFGLARTLLADGDRVSAVDILDEVPDSSSQYVAAQVAAVLSTLDSNAGPLGEPDLLAASQRLERLRLDRARRATLVVEVLGKALRWLATAAPATPGAPAAGAKAGPGSAATVAAATVAGVADGLPPRQPWPQVVRDWLQTRTAAAPTPAAGGRILGGALQERDVRLGLERAYRLLASLEPDPALRHALVDQANSVRPQTVV